MQTLQRSLLLNGPWSLHESVRICGCRIQTEEGEEVGPARVWLSDAWVPGLAMSRALGDGMARRCEHNHFAVSCMHCLFSGPVADPCHVSFGPASLWAMLSCHEIDIVAFLAICRAGVISEPEVCIVDLDVGDHFLILASDGVWEFLDNQSAVDIVSNCSDDEVACSKVSITAAEIRNLRQSSNSHPAAYCYILACDSGKRSCIMLYVACVQLVAAAYARWMERENGSADDITAVIVRFRTRHSIS